MQDQPPAEAILAAIRARMEGEAPPPFRAEVDGGDDEAPTPTADAALDAAPGAEPAAPSAINPADSVLAAEVRALLGPALKRWLDANLPEMVERITRAEIRRMTGHS